jgi:hypothetical protein
MKYFENFTVIPYSFDPNLVSFFNVKNIFERVNFVSSVLDNINVYYEYSFKDSDSIENIAYKYYSSTNRFWMLALSNTLFDAFYDLPLRYNQFLTYLASKYAISADNTQQDTISRTQTTVDHYEKVQINTLSSSNGTITTSNTYSYYPNSVYSIDGYTGTSIPISLPQLNSPPITTSSTISYIGGQLIKTQILNSGSNYTSAPTLTISGNGTGANAYATINNGKIVAVTIDSPGALYTNMTITVSGGSGSIKPIISAVVTCNSTIQLYAVSIYDAENNTNESKRQIKIVDKGYTDIIEKQLRALLTS